MPESRSLLVQCSHTGQGCWPPGAASPLAERDYITHPPAVGWQGTSPRLLSKRISRHQVQAGARGQFGTQSGLPLPPHAAGRTEGRAPPLPAVAAVAAVAVRQQRVAARACARRQLTPPASSRVLILICKSLELVGSGNLPILD